jgi:arabinofuranosyltransferase
MAAFGSRNKIDKFDILIWVILGLVAIIFFVLHGKLAQDDAYITFRYARNLAIGKGFVYNDGEWVFGTTTPFYTLLLALVAYLIKTADILSVSTIINGICLWVSAGIFYEFSKAANRIVAVFISLIFLTTPFLVFFVGMESYVLLCLFMLTIWTYQRGNKNYSGLLNGLLILTRYELIFLTPIIAIWDYMKTRKPAYWMLPGFAPVFLWLIYAQLVFGSPIPLSASVKLSAPRIPFLVGGAVYWYKVIQEDPLSFFVIVVALTGLLGIKYIHRFYREYLLIGIFSIVYLIVASFLAGSFPWYYAPLIPGFIVIVILGVKVIIQVPLPEKLGLNWKTKQIWKYRMQFMILLFIVIVQISFWKNDLYQYQNTIGDNRYPPYRQLSDWLLENATKEQSIATFEIGYIGYFSDIKVVDLAGLITPGLFQWVDDGAEQSLYHALKLYSPDYVLIPNNNKQQIEIMNESHKYYIAKTFLNEYRLYTLIDEK